MRTQYAPQNYFNFAPVSSLNIVNKYREKYEALSMLLDANPELLALAHKDWTDMLSTSEKGRGGYTSEQLLRR